MDLLPVHLPDLAENIFLRLGVEDLHECRNVFKSWDTFIMEHLLREEKHATHPSIAAYKMVHGRYKQTPSKKNTARNTRMINYRPLFLEYDKHSNILYVLNRLKRYTEKEAFSVFILEAYFDGDLLEPSKAVDLDFEHNDDVMEVDDMKVAAGCILLWPQDEEPIDDFPGPKRCHRWDPVIMDLLAIPWGERCGLEIFIDVTLTNISMIRVVSDTIYKITNANIYMTYQYFVTGFESWQPKPTYRGGATNQWFPFVIYKKTRNDKDFQVYCQLDTLHYLIHWDPCCHILINEEIISEKLILLACRQHRTYEIFDHTLGVKLWDVRPDANINLESPEERFLIDSNMARPQQVVKDNYVFIRYPAAQSADIYCSRTGQALGAISGHRFITTDSHVVSFTRNKSAKHTTIRVLAVGKGNKSRIIGRIKKHPSNIFHRDIKTMPTALPVLEIGHVLIICYRPLYFLDLSTPGREVLDGPLTNYNAPHWKNSVVLPNGNAITIQHCLRGSEKQYYLALLKLTHSDLLPSSIK